MFISLDQSQSALVDPPAKADVCPDPVTYSHGQENPHLLKAAIQIDSVE